MVNGGILVYCIVEEPDDRISQINGMSPGEKLRTVKSGGLAAVVSDVDLNEYGEGGIAEKGEDIEWLKEKASVFMDILLNVMSVTQIIPMKFLTIFLSEEKIKGVIDDNLANFLEIFTKIRDHVELSLKIYCDSRKFKASTVAEELLRFEKTLSGKPKGASFFLRKKFETELDDKIQNRISVICNRFAEDLGGYAAGMIPNKTLAKEITGVDIPMIINCAYLVETRMTDQLAGITEAFRQQNTENGIIAELTGPWPPYSFC